MSEHKTYLIVCGRQFRGWTATLLSIVILSVWGALGVAGFVVFLKTLSWLIK